MTSRLVLLVDSYRCRGKGEEHRHEEMWWGSDRTFAVMSCEVTERVMRLLFGLPLDTAAT